MNFIEAVREVEKGKEIRQHHWEEGAFIKRFGYLLAWSDNSGEYIPTVLSILSDNWEVKK